MAGHDSHLNGDRPTDEQIVAFEQQVRQGYTKSVLLVSAALPLEHLRAEYADPAAVIFDAKIQALERTHSSYRKCRGDGNCAYRAIAFRFFELLMTRRSADPVRILNLFDEQHRALLEKAGFEVFAYSDFQDEFLLLLRAVVASVDNSNAMATYLEEQRAAGHNIVATQMLSPTASPKFSIDALELALRCETISNSIIVHLRFLASAHLKIHAADFEPFLDGGMSMQQFCSHSVEAMDREADQLQIIALCNVMQIAITVAYLDQSPMAVDTRSGLLKVTMHEFGQEFASGLALPAQIGLLYRPGHYDILYQREELTATQQS